MAVKLQKRVMHHSQKYYKCARTFGRDKLCSGVMLLVMCRRVTCDNNDKLATFRVDTIAFTEGTVETVKAWLTAKEVRNQRLKG